MITMMFSFVQSSQSSLFSFESIGQSVVQSQKIKEKSQKYFHFLFVLHVFYAIRVGSNRVNLKFEHG